MATANQPGLVSITDYLHGEYEPDAEYVDGVIEERPMGEFDHAAWQQAILLWFNRHAQDWGVLAMQELSVQVAPTRFRVPDVTILRRDQPPEQIITHAPLAVFEVLSPEDRVRRLRRKMDDYAAMGIAQIWLVDPEGPTYERFLDGQLRPAAAFGAAGDRVHFRLAEIAALVPRLGA